MPLLMLRLVEREPNEHNTNHPNWVWLLLVGAVFGVSSAGAIFQQVTMFLHCLEHLGVYNTSLVLAPLVDSMV